MSTQQADKAKKTRTPLTLTVTTIENLSKNLKRIVFTDNSNSLKPEHESGYLKLQFQDDNGEPIRRSYTILEVQNNQETVDAGLDAAVDVSVDFVLHEGGFGATWAKNARIGEQITAMGPGPAKLVDTSLDWFILMGDMTALPAIAVNLKTLAQNKPTATGYAIIEVLDESDIQPLIKPKGIDVEWLVNADNHQSLQKMQSAIADKTWLTGTPYVWIASEFESARGLRQFLREEKGITTDRYVSSYWKIGETDEGNKKAKKADGGF